MNLFDLFRGKSVWIYLWQSQDFFLIGCLKIYLLNEQKFGSKYFVLNFSNRCRYIQTSEQEDFLLPAPSSNYNKIF